MTKREFVEKARKLGYGDGWIEKAIKTMSELNDKYGFDYSYEDIVICEVKKTQEETSNKFVWKSNDIVLFKPKKV